MTKMMTSFDDMSKQVWAATTIKEKKDLLSQMADSFAFKGKGGANVAAFKRSIAACNVASRLDQMAANLALNITDKVVK